MEILIIALLTLLNSFFSLSEIALVSVKESRIQALADQGSSRARTILIIYDDRDYARAVQHLFESHGDVVVCASDGQSGFDRALEVRPDLILLDVVMTEKTEGFFALQRIKRDTALRQTPVIVMSSIVHADHDFFRIAPEAGWLPPDGFLVKPVPPQVLLETASRVTAAR